MKCHVLFSLNRKNTNFRMSFAANFAWHFKGEYNELFFFFQPINRGAGVSW